MRITIQLLLVLVCAMLVSFKGNKSATKSEGYTYINEFKELAIAEMHRSGIPASITLAQGMHESNYGASNLATKANNHFGIKCKSYWKGQTYYHKDDDFDKNGKLMKSCFRAYNDSVESYIDHSNFLKYSSNYVSLFNLHHTNYIAWAHGLKQSGYATDPNYAEKLIRIIENYNLNQFDRISEESLRNY